MKENKIECAGLLSLHDAGEASDVLFISSISEPLAEFLEYRIARRQVSARYWITDKQVSKEAAQEEFLKTIFGNVHCRFMAHYSEITGYLWTDEECVIGGHDLLNELKSFVGKWLILEITVHSR